MKDDEIHALKQFKEGLSFDGERYEVLIYDQLYHYLDSSNVIFGKQSAYR